VSVEQQAEDLVSVLVAFRPDRRAGAGLADLGCAQGPVDPPFGLAALLSERGVRALVAVLEVAVVVVFGDVRSVGSAVQPSDLDVIQFDACGQRSAIEATEARYRCAARRARRLPRQMPLGTAPTYAFWSATYRRNDGTPGWAAPHHPTCVGVGTTQVPGLLYEGC
jgi:hypothetical protein